MNLKKIIKLAKRNGTYERVYGELVHKKIRSKLNESEEIALLRKEVMLLKREISLLRGEEIPQTEFEGYNLFAEQCKIEIKNLINESEEN